MATAVLQQVRRLGRHLGFFKIFIFSKTAASSLVFLKLVENIFLLPQIGI